MMTNDQVLVYAQGTQLLLVGSFQTNGAAAPTIIRDGHCTLVTSVVRVSAGVFLVQMEQCPEPEKPVVAFAYVNPAANAVPTVGCAAAVVDSTYSNSTRQFTVRTYSLAAAPAAVDPDVGARVGFMIVGSINSAGTDNA